LERKGVKFDFSPFRIQRHISFGNDHFRGAVGQSFVQTPAVKVKILFFGPDLPEIDLFSRDHGLLFHFASAVADKADGISFLLGRALALGGGGLIFILTRRKTSRGENCRQRQNQ